MADRVYFGKGNIKPDFLNQKNDSDKETVEIYESAQSAAKNNLKNYEKSASSEIPEEEQGTATATAKGSETNFTYTGSGRRNTKRNNRSLFSAKTPRTVRLRRQAPLLAIIAIIIIGVFFAFSSMGTLGSQIETLITRATDTMFGSYSENTLRITEELLDGKRGKFPNYFKKRLKDQNISVTSVGSGYSLNYSGQTITSKNLRSVYSNDIAFREAFTKAKRGRTSNFFDMSATFAFTKLGISRNLYRNFKQSDNDETNTKNFKQTESDVFDDSTASSLNTVTERQKTDEDGNPVYDENGNPVMERVKSGEDVTSSQDSNSRARAKNYLTDIAGRVSDTTSIACATLKVANMVSVSIAAAEIYQSINYFLTNAENISKTKAGDGSNAAQNQLLNQLNEPVEAKYVDVESGEEKTVKGAPIEAEGFANVLSGTAPDLKKTRNYSVESAFTASAFAIGLSALNNKACGGLRAVGATVSIAIGIFGGGIIHSIATLAKTTLINAALAATISATLSFLVPKIASALFENTADSLAGIPAGETFVKGAALGNKKVARSTSGQMLADKATASAYARQTQIAAANESEIQRRNTSEFDISSPDTFLGKLTTEFGTLAAQSSIFSSLRAFSSLAKNSSTSLLNLFGANTFAATDLNNPNYQTDTELAGTDYSDVFSDDSTCANLTSIGAACDMYGAEITATDPAVMNVSSTDPTYQKVLKKNVKKNDDGTYSVIPNSLLANKIMYCDERDSPFGVYDSNIANAFETSLGFGDNIPILSDVIDLVNAVEDMSPETEGWATGKYCVMGSSNPYYGDLIYLQHFTEDMRIAVQLELDEVGGENAKSPTVAYKEDYYKVNPIDKSTSGILARYTGYTKSEMEEMLAAIKYYEAIGKNSETLKSADKTSTLEYESLLSNQNINDLISFLSSKTSSLKPNKTHDSEALTKESVIYADLRSRSYAA